VASTQQSTTPTTEGCGAIHPQTDVMRRTGLIIKPCARPAGHEGHGGKPRNSIGQSGHVFHVEQSSEGQV
jgi:hypothetical protein